MKIIVLNGSPKGDVSVTMQYVKYIQKVNSKHEFKFFNVAHQIKKIEKEEALFNDMISEINSCDGVLWAFPLYVCLVNSGYKRFIELLWERNAIEAFSNKYTAALSTSIHFFDNTAHNYIHAICDDLNMKYLGYFSAEMDDLMKKEGQRQLEVFAQDFFSSIEKSVPSSKLYKTVDFKVPEYKPGETVEKINSSGKKIVLVTDSENINTNLGRMVERFKNSFTEAPEFISLDKAKIKGGCLGCLHCGFDNKCIYGDSDDIKEIYNTKIKKADIVVFAGTITDRFLSSKWQMFIERRFLNTHQPQMIGKQFGYIISGPLSQASNLSEIIQAIAELDKCNLVDIINDEHSSSNEIDMLIDNFAAKLLRMAEEKYVKPATFLGIGGTKLFRDEIWGKLRFVFQGDFKFYKKHEMMDFPQKNISVRLTNRAMTLLTKIPSARKHIQKEMKNYMISPYKKILENR